jgi:hypothetical protein
MIFKIPDSKIQEFKFQIQNLRFKIQEIQRFKDSKFKIEKGGPL